MRRTFFGLPLLAAAALAGCGEGGPDGSPGKGKDTGPPVVTAAAPLVKTVTQFTDVTGTLKAVKRVEVRPQVGGIIQKVHFKDGADVSEGEVLVTIDPVLYAADVKKAEGELANAKAQAKLAATEAGRLKRLIRGNSVSQDEVDRAQAQVGVTEAQILTAQAELDRSRQNLAYTQVKAPFAGRVGRILVNEGNLVAGGAGSATPGQASVLTILTTIDPIYAYFDLDEQTVLYYLDLINAGKFAGVRERAVPIELALKGQPGYPYKGELDFAATELSATTGSLTVRATVPNPEPTKFTPGLFVRARLPGAKVENAVLVPESAVVVDQERKVLYVVTADDTISTRPVKLGPRSEGLRVVLSGVKAGERVVIRGVQRVQDGVKVEVEAGRVEPVPEPALDPVPATTIAP